MYKLFLSVRTSQGNQEKNFLHVSKEKMRGQNGERPAQGSPQVEGRAKTRTQAS